MDLQGKVAVVTGATGGIGQEICRLFKENGARVIGIHKHIKKDSEIETGIDYVISTVADYEETRQTIEGIIEKYGKIDILVNNAGINRDAMTKNMTEDQFDKVVATNLKGVWNVTRFIGPHMQRNHGGSIINISSIVGIYGNVGQSNYAASKAGIIGMTKSWAKEFAVKDGNVRVNSIAPGFIKTKMLDGIPPKTLDKIREKIMLGRLGEPSEIAQVVLFLASDRSSYITGTNINANGGMAL
ncbi:SDR family oxidoreductase [Lachnospiraceae bacterium 47-T17]